MSVAKKEKGWQRREIAATVGAALLLLEEFDRQGPSTKALKATHEASIAEARVTFPVALSNLGAAGFFLTSRGCQSACNVLPMLDPLLRQLLNEVPLYFRGADIPRVGWDSSPLYHALRNWPNSEFKKRLRLSRPVFNMIVDKLVAAGCVKDNKCSRTDRHVTAEFKVAVAIMHLAHGGTWWQTGFSAGIAPDTAEFYTKEVCQAIIQVLKPEYMPGKPTPEEAEEIQKRFKARRGIPDVGGAVDGTHCPFQPDSAEFMEDFHNYKGWYSLLCVALVNSFYMFMDAEVGRPGRMADSTATQLSYFYEQITIDREGWLGKNGVLVSDGACGISDFIMVPYPGTILTNKQQWFNFCFSSTRMYVEQVFGMWKSRWRVCIREQQCSHSLMSLMIFATMILHNVCQFYSQDPEMSCGDDYMDDDRTQVDMLRFMQNCPLPRCKKCRTDNVMHCVHRAVPVIDSSPGAQNMYDRREVLANKLWLAKCQDDLDRGM